MDVACCRFIDSNEQAITVPARVHARHRSCQDLRLCPSSPPVRARDPREPRLQTMECSTVSVKLAARTARGAGVRAVSPHRGEKRLGFRPTFPEGRHGRCLSNRYPRFSRSTSPARASRDPSRQRHRVALRTIPISLECLERQRLGTRRILRKTRTRKVRAWGGARRIHSRALSPCSADRKRARAPARTRKT